MAKYRNASEGKIMVLEGRDKPKTLIQTLKIKPSVGAEILETNKPGVTVTKKPGGVEITEYRK